MAYGLHALVHRFSGEVRPLPQDYTESGSCGPALASSLGEAGPGPLQGWRGAFEIALRNSTR